MTVAGQSLNRLYAAILSVCALLAWPVAASAQNGQIPNIVIIVADDMGFHDAGFNGGPVTTPRLDEWVSQAIRFDRFYSQPVCSPTRAGLLTGRFPIRFGMQWSTVAPGELYGLPQSEETLAEALERAGYTHRALIGKWHLGQASPDHHPMRNGFSEFFGHITGGVGYWFHWHRQYQPDMHRDYEPLGGTEGQYLTDLTTHEALKFLTARGKDREPFFLYLPYFAPHQPNQVPVQYLNANAHIEDPLYRAHAGLMTSLDENIGKVFDALQGLGFMHNTIVVFLSDNGGDMRYAGETVNGPLRGGKGEVFEGGIRVPAAISWPAAGWTGGRTISQQVGYIDIMPTLLAAAGVAPAAEIIDGRDLGPVLSGAVPDEPAARDWFVYQGGNETEGNAFFEWPWKLVRYGGDPRDPSTEDEARYELFNIVEDPSESRDLSRRHPDIVERLRARIVAYRELQPTPGVRQIPPAPDWIAPTDWQLVGGDLD